MFNLQGSEIIIILLLALVVLGPEKLPDAIRKFSQTYGELKKMGNGFQSELKSALDEPMKEMRDTAQLLQDAADPKKVSEQAEADLAKKSERDAAAAAGVDTRPAGTLDPGSTVAESSGEASSEALDDESGSDESTDSEAPAEKSKPINQIAAANARQRVADADMPTPNGVAAAEAIVAARAAELEEIRSGAMDRVTNGAAPNGFEGLAPPTGPAAQLLPPPVPAAEPIASEP